MAGHMVVSWDNLTGLDASHLTQENEFSLHFKNHRVLLLDKQLNIQRVLLTYESKRRPQRLLFDRETTQLMVGLSSGEVEVFSLL
jgi:hypothetical protein